MTVKVSPNFFHADWLSECLSGLQYSAKEYVFFNGRTHWRQYTCISQNMPDWSCFMICFEKQLFIFLDSCIFFFFNLKRCRIMLFAYHFLSNFIGFSVGSNRSFSILGLLGACTVCRCNQRHSPWKMAVFLMCLFF